MGELTQTRALQLELLAILSSIKVLEHQRKKAVFALLNEENKKVCGLVIEYFIQEEFDAKQQLVMWRKLLDYREDMVQTYGDRVSLHIACYHLTRDPDSLEEVGLPSLVRCTRGAQALAIQELKAWWERCSESGAHLKEVMNEQLERMVYRANKNNQLLSFVLIKIMSTSKEVLDAETRSSFARHLMDSCRCRDIVGHYEKDLLAIIFPQTPADGAKIAIGRVSQFFHEKFGEGKYVWQVAIATCPDNGVTPQELVLMAEDRLSKMKKTKVDHVESCEGKASKLYLNFSHYIKQPALQILSSPLKTAIALLILAAAFAAMLKVTGSNSDQWKIELELVMNENQTFPEWTWGRGDSDEFDLEFIDGFVSHSNEYILENQNDHWLAIPDSSSDRVKLEFKVWLSALSEMNVSFGALQKPDLNLTLDPDGLEIKQGGILLYKMQYENIVDDYVDITLEWGLHDVQMSISGEQILEPTWLPHQRQSGGKIYFQMESGFALVSELKLYGKKDESKYDLKSIEIMTRLMSLSEQSRSEKVSALLPMLSEHLLAKENVKEEVREYLKNPDETPPDWLAKIISSPELKGFWMKHLPQLYRAAPELIHELKGVPDWVQQHPVDLKTAQQRFESMLKTDEAQQFLEFLVAKNLTEKDKDLYSWAWKQLVQNAPRDLEDKIELFLQFIQEAGSKLKVGDVESVFHQLGNLSPKNNVDIYYVLKSYLESLGKVGRESMLDYNYIDANPVLQLLSLQYMPEGEKKIECVERISLDIGKTNFGKALCYEWMWFSVHKVEKITREERVLLEQLSLQSRRPKLASLALEKLEK
jgi:GGDEF domain-containing protein